MLCQNSEVSSRFQNAIVNMGSGDFFLCRYLVFIETSVPKVLKQLFIYISSFVIHFFILKLKHVFILGEARWRETDNYSVIWTLLCFIFVSFNLLYWKPYRFEFSFFTFNIVLMRKLYQVNDFFFNIFFFFILFIFLINILSIILFVCY